ncbi:MAG TPA: aldehyde dehydrogenase family protein [Bacteroidales bacterium]|nr:aldehyde dehydrogenase family protein [Bacteroidales bacterium]
MDTYPFYCGGNFIKSPRELLVLNPYDGKVFARTWLAGDDEFEQAIDSALLAFASLKSLSSFERSAALSEIAQKITIQEDGFASLIAQEAGKPWRYAVGEVRRAAQTFRVAAEEAKRLPFEYLQLDWTPDTNGREGLVKYFPVGPIAGISPFNFPLNLAVHKIAPALAAGCPIILKPASTTPLSTLRLAKIIDETALPKGSVSILPMDRITGNRLVTDERFKLLTFTGSPEVGWKMKQGAGKKKVVLELGGNAGTIVASSANLEHAMNRSLVGGFAYQGQVCIHAQRIFLHHSHFDEFTRRFAHGADALRYGDPLSTDTLITAMIDLENAIRVEQWIEEARAAGARVLCGGIRNGNYVQPTVITHATPGMKVFDEEVFGPVVTINPFDTFAEAVEMVNLSRFGLQAAVFTNQIDELDFAFQNLETGGVIHNDSTIFRTDHMPYGGIKDSGLGREGVKYAMHDMLEPRILVKNKT